MPYCTIEEAWTQSLNPEHEEKNTETNKKKYCCYHGRDSHGRRGNKSNT